LLEELFTCSEVASSMIIVTMMFISLMTVNPVQMIALPTVFVETTDVSAIKDSLVKKLSNYLCV
jgi:hypothetical protein